jgi:hypothetical protein
MKLKVENNCYRKKYLHFISLDAENQNQQQNVDTGRLHFREVIKKDFR